MYHVSAQGVDERMINVHSSSSSYIRSVGFSRAAASELNGVGRLCCLMTPHHWLAPLPCHVYLTSLLGIFGRGDRVGWGGGGGGGGGDCLDKKIILCSQWRARAKSFQAEINKPAHQLVIATRLPLHSFFVYTGVILLVYFNRRKKKKKAPKKKSTHTQKRKSGEFWQWVIVTHQKVGKEAKKTLTPIPSHAPTFPRGRKFM